MEKKQGCACARQESPGGRPTCEYVPALRDSWGVCDYPLAMVYAPVQAFRGLYDPRVALSRGTMFCELDLPLEAVANGRNTGGCSSGACDVRGGRQSACRCGRSQR